MSTSLVYGEGSCSYKGYNNPFGIGCLIAYSAGSNVLPEHVGQPSLILLHDN